MVLHNWLKGEACVQAHFSFRCNDFKLFNANSALEMDDKQSTALSNFPLKKEDAPGPRADLGWWPPMMSQARASTANYSSRNSSIPRARRRGNKGEKRFSQSFSYAAGLFLRNCHEYLKFWSHFSPNRMNRRFVKRLFRRTCYPGYVNSHNYFSSLPEAWTAREARKKGKFNSVAWPQAFCKELKFLFFFSRSRCTISSAGRSPASQCTEHVKLHGTLRRFRASRSCCRPVISAWLALHWNPSWRSRR